MWDPRRIFLTTEFVVNRPVQTTRRVGHWGGVKSCLRVGKKKKNNNYKKYKKPTDPAYVTEYRYAWGKSVKQRSSFFWTSRTPSSGTLNSDRFYCIFNIIKYHVLLLRDFFFFFGVEGWTASYHISTVPRPQKPQYVYVKPLCPGHFEKAATTDGQCRLR